MMLRQLNFRSSAHRKTLVLQTLDAVTDVKQRSHHRYVVADALQAIRSVFNLMPQTWKNPWLP